LDLSGAFGCTENKLLLDALYQYGTCGIPHRHSDLTLRRGHNKYT